MTGGDTGQTGANAIERPLSLRPPEADDAPALFDAIRESMTELTAWMSWCRPDYGLEDARGWIGRSIASRITRFEHNFLVMDARSRILGTCGLNQLRLDNRLANLGYWIRSSATGSGVAPEAVGRLAEYAFSQTDLARLEIVVAVGNTRSRRVAEKAGAIFEGVAKDRIFIHGTHSDAAMFVLLRSAWRAVP